MFEVLIFCGFCTGFFTFGVIAGKLITKNYMTIKKIKDEIYSIHYKIENETYSILIEPSKTKKLCLPVKLTDTNGNDMNTTIESFIRGTNSVVPLNNIVLPYIGINDTLYVQDGEFDYAISTKSVLFGGLLVKDIHSLV